MKPPKTVKAKHNTDVTRLAELLGALRGQKIQDMPPKQIAELLAVVLIELGKANADGSVK